MHEALIDHLARSALHPGADDAPRAPAAAFRCRRQMPARKSARRTAGKQFKRDTASGIKMDRTILRRNPLRETLWQIDQELGEMWIFSIIGRILRSM